MGEAISLSKGEATLGVKVTKANGEVIEMEGTEIIISEDLNSLIEEYKITSKKAMELENKIISLLGGK